MKKFILFVSYGFVLFAARPIIQISIPKSGTHLLAKSISQITKKSMLTAFKKMTLIDWYYVAPVEIEKIILPKISNNYFWVTHLAYNEELEDYFINDLNAIIFFIYRDPRDQVVSFMNYGKRMKWFHGTDSEIITNLLNGKLLNPPAENIVDYYYKYISWIESEGVCAIKFENLVGQKGGGLLYNQQMQINKIAKHLQKDMTQEQINAIANNLFGGSNTFFKGIIGSWKHCFTNIHKDLFKSCGGTQLLIELGYEQDDTW